MKELEKEFKIIKEKMGLNAYESLTNYYYTLWRKIEDLTISRNKWKEKYKALKEEMKNK